MANNVSVQYNGGSLPDIKLLNHHSLLGNLFKGHKRLYFLPTMQQKLYTRSRKSLRTCKT